MKQILVRVSSGEIIGVSSEPVAPWKETPGFVIAAVADGVTPGMFYDADAGTARIAEQAEKDAFPAAVEADKLTDACANAAARFDNKSDAYCRVTFGAILAVNEQCERLANGEKLLTGAEVLARAKELSGDKDAF